MRWVVLGDGFVWWEACGVQAGRRIEATGRAACRQCMQRLGAWSHAPSIHQARRKRTSGAWTPLHGERLLPRSPPPPSLPLHQVRLQSQRTPQPCHGQWPLWLLPSLLCRRRRHERLRQAATLRHPERRPKATGPAQAAAAHGLPAPLRRCWPCGLCRPAQPLRPLPPPVRALHPNRPSPQSRRRQRRRWQRW